MTTARTRTFVKAETLLKCIWPDLADGKPNPDRPSLRWIRYQQKRRTIPFIRIGGKVLFDPEAVSAHWSEKCVVKPRF